MNVLFDNRQDYFIISDILKKKNNRMYRNSIKSWE